MVELNVAATVDAVRPFANLGGPVCAIGIDVGQEERFDVGYVMPCLAADRERTSGPAGEGWVDHWSPDTFRDDAAVLVRGVDASPDFAAAEPVLRRALEGRVLGPAEWVMARVARALSLASMPFPTTDDFIAVAFDTSFSALLFDQLEFSAPPDRFALLKERGLVGTRDDLE